MIRVDGFEDSVFTWNYSSRLSLLLILPNNNNMIAVPRRQQHLKLAALPSPSFSPKAKLNQYNSILHYHPDIIISAPINARPPTSNHTINRPQNVFIRRVKAGSTRTLKSKTGHLSYKESQQTLNQQKYQLKQPKPGKFQSMHRANSAKSFLIRKANTSSSAKRPQTPSVNCQFQLLRLQRQMMQQINHNSEKIQQKYCNQTILDKPKESVDTKQPQQQIKDRKYKNKSDELQNTIASQKFERIENNNVFELLQTKKSCYFSKNQSKNTKQYAIDDKNRHEGKVLMEEDKQNFQQLPQKCIKFDIQSSYLFGNSNKCLRKQDKHKSNKQFDRKEKLHSACRTIRVPWNQLQSATLESPKPKLKRQRLQFKKQYEQLTENHKVSLLFGGISMIGSKGMKSSMNSGVGTQSLRDLWNQLQLKQSCKHQ